MSPQYCAKFWELYDALACACNERAKVNESLVNHLAGVRIAAYIDAANAVSQAKAALDAHKASDCPICRGKG